MFGSVPKPVILQLSLNVRARVERPPGDDASKIAENFIGFYVGEGTLSLAVRSADAKC
jgi:hypothetical protein